MLSEDNGMMGYMYVKSKFSFDLQRTLSIVSPWDFIIVSGLSKSP